MATKNKNVKDINIQEITNGEDVKTLPSQGENEWKKFWKSVWTFIKKYTLDWLILGFTFLTSKLKEVQKKTSEKENEKKENEKKDE